MIDHYPWLLAAHILFVIFWMAGLLIFPRYLVYHQEAIGRRDAADAARWVRRERSLKRIILTPALLVVWALGIALATVGHYWGQGWLDAKLVFVLLLSGYHGWAIGYARRLAGGRARLSDRALRLVNEVPAVGVLVIVILAVVKPF